MPWLSGNFVIIRIFCRRFSDEHEKDDQHGPFYYADGVEQLKDKNKARIGWTQSTQQAELLGARLAFALLLLSSYKASEVVVLSDLTGVTQDMDLDTRW